MQMRAVPLGPGADGRDVIDKAVGVGLVVYGVVHLLIAWLAVRLAFGGGGGSASGSGALRELAKTTPGRISLYVVAAGLFVLVAWQVAEALVGHHDEDGAKRSLKRVTSAGRAVVYGVLAVSAVKVAFGAGSGSGTDSMTEKLMSVPAGQALVGLVGVGVLVVAGFLAFRGCTDKFMKKLDFDGHTGKDGHAYRWLGRAGYLTKAVALGIVGALFCWAAISHDPQRSGGLDQALHKVLQLSFGSVLLAVIAAGIACYGLFCFAWARHLDR